MDKQYMMKNNILILLIFFLPLFIFLAPVSSQFHELTWGCDGVLGNYTANSTYQKNLKPLLVYLTAQASHALFGYYSVGEGMDKVGMIYQCIGNLNLQECHDCIQQAAERIVTLCPVEKEALFWYQECMLRYSNRTIFSVEDENYIAFHCSTANVSDPLRYSEVVARTIDGLIMEAAYNRSKVGYAIGEGNATGLVRGNKVYCLVQCTPDILGSRCERCLRAALGAIAGCCGTSREMVQFYYTSCHILYSAVNFIRGPASPPALPISPPLQPNSLPLPPPRIGSSMARMIKAERDFLTIGLIVAASMLFTMFTSN